MEAIESCRLVEEDYILTASKITYGSNQNIVLTMQTATFTLFSSSLLLFDFFFAISCSPKKNYAQKYPTNIYFIYFNYFLHSFPVLFEPANKKKAASALLL